MRKICLGLVLLCIGAIMASCGKSSIIGAEVIPGDDILNAQFTDTISIITFTERDDTLLSSKLNTYLLGSMEDPIFGKSFAGIYAQLRLPSNELNFPNNPTLDSVVLTLRYAKDLYGKKSSPHTIVVYEVTQDMDVQKSYFSDQTFSINTAELGRIQNVVPQTLLPVYAGGDTLLPHLRIRLDNSFGQKLLNQSGTVNFQSNEDFLKFFKGLYISPDTSMGFAESMMHIDMLSTLSTVTLYYKNSVEDSLSQSFDISGNSAIVNQFKHNYSGTTISDQLLNSGEDSLGYIQGMAGLRVRVQFPNISNFGNISINKAELVITAKNLPSNDTFSLPQQLLPRTVNKNTGTVEATLDEALSIITSSYSLGGAKEQVVINGETYSRYKINLVRFLSLLSLQQVTDTDLLIVLPARNESAARIVVGGGNHPDPALRMKVNLFYTKL